MIFCLLILILGIMMKIVRTSINSLNDKFSRLFTLLNSIYPTDLPPVNQNVVVNLSNTTLSKLQCSVSNLNSNFETSKELSFQQLIAPIEKAFKKSRLTNLCHLILANSPM